MIDFLFFYLNYKNLLFFSFELISYIVLYGLNKDDVILIEAAIYYWFEGKDEEITNMMDNQIIELADKGNPEAMYNLINI